MFGATLGVMPSLMFFLNITNVTKLMICIALVTIGGILLFFIGPYILFEEFEPFKKHKHNRMLGFGIAILGLCMMFIGAPIIVFIV
jgi:MFS family permease